MLVRKLSEDGCAMHHLFSGCSAPWLHYSYLWTPTPHKMPLCGQSLSLQPVRESNPTRCANTTRSIRR